MRTWSRSGGDQLCGRCKSPIGRTDPILIIRLHGGTSVRVRCQACADEPVPSNLPPLPALGPVRSILPVPTGPGALPFDWKTCAAVAEREPGEDDQ